jgi:hypothetical protein
VGLELLAELRSKRLLETFLDEALVHFGTYVGGSSVHGRGGG